MPSLGGGGRAGGSDHAGSGSSDRSGGSSSSGGGERDTMPGMTVTGKRPSHKSPGDGGEHGEKDTRSFKEKAETMAKNVSQNIVNKFIDGLMMSNPVTGIPNLASMLFTGKTLTQHLTNTVREQLEAGATPEVAAAVATKVAAKTIADDTENDFGGAMGKDAAINTFTQMSADPTLTAPHVPRPTGAQIPGNVLPGINQYVTDTGKASSDYQTKAGKIEADWKDFEKQYFDEYQGIKDDYKSQMAGVPGLSLQMPESMGGARVGMAPTAHQGMYQREANALAGITGQQANTGLAGLQGRTGLAQNMYGVDFAQAGANRLPADLAMDLYKMERAGQLGLQQVEAGKPDEKSGWETWAPVVGGMLSKGAGGTSAADELKSLFTEGWG